MSLLRLLYSFFVSACFCLNAMFALHVVVVMIPGRFFWSMYIKPLLLFFVKTERFINSYFQPQPKDNS